VALQNGVAHKSTREKTKKCESALAFAREGLTENPESQTHGDFEAIERKITMKKEMMTENRKVINSDRNVCLTLASIQTTKPLKHPKS
jgi:hypothetical protein